MMLIKTITVGPLEANCYIVWDDETLEAMVIDPGDEPDRIIDVVKKNGLTIEYIVLTHAHFDHVGAVVDMKNALGGKVAVHEDEMEIYNAVKDQGAFWGYDIEPLPKPDMLLKEADVIKLGSLIFKVLHTPGHSPGSICLLGEGVVITGDTLFQGAVGRTDFYGGDMGKLKESFKRLLTLPDAIKVFAGHGPFSTIGKERSENLFSGEI